MTTDSVPLTADGNAAGDDGAAQFAKPRRFLTGLEALLEGILLQRRLDRSGNAAIKGFVSGYRGSPLGSFDSLLWSNRKKLEEVDIRFEPGLNEDLAATACWGTQQLHTFGTANVQGVTAFWYGKGPGVDRAGDVLKHANMAGTMPLGGVVMLVGDDHGAKSSTVAHQSDQALIAAGIPILYPATVQEYVDLIPSAVALSRFSGLWVAFKCVTETVEASALVRIEETAVGFTIPPKRPGPVPLGFQPVAMEKSLVEERLPAARDFATANAFDRVTLDGPVRRLGIVAAGKSHVDLMEALRLLGIEDSAQELGIRIFKPLMVWPLAPEPVLEFCRDHAEILVVEEKRSLVEDQLAGLLLRQPAGSVPLLSGKADSERRTLLPEHGELNALSIARAVVQRLKAHGIVNEAIEERLAALSPLVVTNKPLQPRKPAFCSGCPHNRSTRLPDGSVALGGIGCHGMALMVPELRTPSATQMGGEGANWIGLAPYVDTDHIFQNMGEGTYTHSGLLAIRAAVAAGVNITFKILHNGATAMTGGQPVEGEFSADEITAQLAAEGVKRIILVTENPQRSRSLPSGVTLRARTDLELVQQELRAVPGVTAIVYEQACAAERRRKRKQRIVPDPAIRTWINPEVCEGCGDCGAKSSCVSLVPVPTELGTKRAVDQESCNKDYTCVEGFCPSFVTVLGGAPRVSQIDADMAERARKALEGCDPETAIETGNLLIAGIGGTGTITLGRTLAQAAIAAGKKVTTFDVTGLAQKNGAVYSHIRILVAEDERQYQPRIPDRQLDTLIGCDLVSAAAPAVAPMFDSSRTTAFVNTHVTPVAAFQRNPDLKIEADDYLVSLGYSLPAQHIHEFSLGEKLSRILGSGPLANVALLGFAMQRGTVPVSPQQLEAAMSRRGKPDIPSIFALRMGRLLSISPERCEAILDGGRAAAPVALSSRSFDEIVARGRDMLTVYQNSAYANLFEERARAIKAMDLQGEVARVAAFNLFKLMRYKDEYEVARLYADPAFLAGIRRDFKGDVKFRFNLAPPLLARHKTATGEPAKIQFGGWVLTLFRLLAKFKFLRGTMFDPFGWSADRKLERQLPEEYMGWVMRALRSRGDDTGASALEVAKLGDMIRGYGPVKDRNVNLARATHAKLSER